MTATVPTARGDEISVDQLGMTLMHEHTFNLSPEINQNYPETWGDEELRVANAIAEYQALKAAGVDTIVDATIIGLGRFVPRIRRIAEQVELNIIVATGVYIWDALPMFFTVQGPGTDMGGPETMDDLFVRDIVEGIGNSGVRAGILKVATDKYGLTPGVERVLRASASAHRRTGVPITTHTFDVPNGLQQQQILREEGVDLSRVIVGHMDRAGGHDLDYIETIIGNGSMVGFDQFGVPVATDESRLAAVTELCRRGHAKSIVLSHDHNCFCDMVPQEWFEHMPDWRKTYIPQDILPELKRRGVSDEEIRLMTRDNPRRIFATAAAGPY